MRRRIAGLLMVLPILSCFAPGAEERATEQFRFTPPDRPRLMVRLDRGSVSITGGEPAEVRVTVTRRARARRPEDARQRLAGSRVDVRQEGETVRVEARSHAGSSPWDGSDLRADVSVALPSNSAIDVHTRDGRIEITRVHGVIEAESEDGSIRLDDVRGRVAARTLDGSIRGQRLEGLFDVSTLDGRIELAGVFRGLSASSGDGRIVVDSEEALPLERDWILRTADGSIELRLPEDISARLDASAADGRITSDLTLTQKDEREGRLTGRLGEGEHDIIVKTSDGSISIRSR